MSNLKKAVRLTNELFREGKGDKYPIIEEWRIGEKILKRYKEKLAGAFKDTDILEACLVLNALYSTRIYTGDVVPCANVLCKFLKGYNNEEERINQWEYIEKNLIPEIEKQTPSGRVPKSFLSKFFHFFVDDEVFPIFDSYARIAAGIILVKLNVLDQGKRKIENAIRGGVKYSDYCDYIKKISELSGTDNYRQLDRFLWIAGHYWSKSWSKNWKKMFKGIKEDNSFNEIINYLDTLFERPG